MKNFKISTKQEFFAYRILKGDKIYKKSVEKKYDFDYLLKILKPFNSEFFKDYKIWLVLIIKWEFDYLCRKLVYYLMNFHQKDLHKHPQIGLFW